MPDTGSIRKLSLSLKPAVATLIVTLLGGLGGWLLNTVDSLQITITTLEGRMAAMEAARVENKAQWKALFENRDRMTEMHIRLEATNTVFRMLLDQDKIKTNKISLPKLRPPPRTQERWEDFRQEQLQQQMPKMPSSRK